MPRRVVAMSYVLWPCSTHLHFDGSLHFVAFAPVHSRVPIGSAAGVISLDLNLNPIREA